LDLLSNFSNCQKGNLPFSPWDHQTKHWWFYAPDSKNRKKTNKEDWHALPLSYLGGKLEMVNTVFSSAVFHISSL
jgi:hypothetical protein